MTFDTPRWHIQTGKPWAARLLASGSSRTISSHAIERFQIMLKLDHSKSFILDNVDPSLKDSVCDGYHWVSLPVTFPNMAWHQNRLQVWYLGSFGSLCNHWFHCQGQRVTGVRKYGSVGIENSTISMILYIHFQLCETKNPIKKINESMMYNTRVAIPCNSHVRFWCIVAMARVQHRAVALWWVGSWTWVHSYRRSAAGVEQKHWMRVLPMVGVLKMKCQLEIEKHSFWVHSMSHFWNQTTKKRRFVPIPSHSCFAPTCRLFRAYAGAWFCHRIKHNHQKNTSVTVFTGALDLATRSNSLRWRIQIRSWERYQPAWQRLGFPFMHGGEVKDGFIWFPWDAFISENSEHNRHNWAFPNPQISRSFWFFVFFWNCWGVCQVHVRKLLESTSTYVCTVCSILNILGCF